MVPFNGDWVLQNVFKVLRKVSERCREASHEKDVLKTWNNLSRNMSDFKDLYGATRPNFTEYEFSIAKD